MGGGCQGAAYGISRNANHCYPFDLWSGTLDSGGSYKLGQLISGTWHVTAYASTFAFSVRCLLLALYGHRVRFHPYCPKLWYAVSWVCMHAAYRRINRMQFLSYGATWCGSYSDGCQGSGNSSCWPYVTWSSKLISTEYYYAHDLAKGIFYEAKQAGHPLSHAIGVRCVPGLSTSYE